MNLQHRPDATADLLLPVAATLLGHGSDEWVQRLDRAVERWGWDRFTRVLWENRISLRTAYAFQHRLPSVAPERWKSLIEAEEKRQKKMLDYMQLLSERLELEFMFIKTVDNFPDFGHDVDLLTRESGKRVHEEFLKKGFSRGDQTLAERISDKMNFTIDNSCPAEAHCARIGEFGEHREFTQYLLDHRVPVQLGGLEVWGATYPARVLLLVAQRLYRHFTLRTCDVLNAVSWFRAGAVTVSELYELASRFGFLPGARWFVRFLNEVEESCGGEPVVEAERRSDVLCCDRNLFRFSRVRFVPLMVGGKLLWSLSRLKWSSFGRELLFVPIGAMAVVSYKVFKRRGFW